MKLTSQMPSSTSLMPSFWPASTVEMVIFLRPHRDISDQVLRQKMRQRTA